MLLKLNFTDIFDNLLFLPKYGRKALEIVSVF